MLSFFASTAHADLWAYVDDQGVTHFAATQVDERYKLFFKGADFEKLNLLKDATTSLKQSAAAPRATAAPVLPKRFAALDSSQSYKAVQKHLKQAARTHALDVELLKAVVAAESGFDPMAVSPKGAVGLMQLMPATAAQYGVVADAQDRKDKKGKLIPAQTIEQKLTDPHTNINAGARYLSHLIKLFKGELPLAVAAYNAGEGAVQRAGNKIPNYKETQGYVKTVMGLYGVFKPDQTAGTTVVSRLGAQPVASAVGKVGGRVRVELGRSSAGRTTVADAGADKTAAAPSTASSAADSGTPMLTPVVYTVPNVSSTRDEAGATASAASGS